MTRIIFLDSYPINNIDSWNKQNDRELYDPIHGSPLTTSPSSAPIPNRQKSNNNVTSILAANASTTARHAEYVEYVEYVECVEYVDPPLFP